MVHLPEPVMFAVNYHATPLLLHHDPTQVCQETPWFACAKDKTTVSVAGYMSAWDNLCYYYGPIINGGKRVTYHVRALQVYIGIVG